MSRTIVVCMLGIGCNVPGGALESDVRDGDAMVDAPLDVPLDVPVDVANDVANDAPIGVDAEPDDAGAADADHDAEVIDAGVLDAGIDSPLDACVPVDEICNGIDDDCNGFIDEAGCEGCTRVESPGLPGHVYLFCDDAKRNWDDAHAFCADLGYRLADVQTELEHGFVWMRAQSVRDDHWWIGLRETDAWRWTRGEAAHPDEATAYNGWISGNPGDGQECARMKKDADGVEATFSDGGWETKPCTDNHFVVCEVGG